VPALSHFFAAVFFDMDGLVVDSEPEWLLSETEVTQEFGYSWTHEDQIACLGGPLTRVGEYMSEKCGKQESAEFFTQTLIDTQVNRMRRNTPTMPGAVEIVQQLQERGIKTGLVSASPRIIVDTVLDTLGHNLFPFSISSNDVEKTKPDPEGYIKAATIANVSITDCLIFEDSLTGIKAAQASGAYVIAVPQLVTVRESERVRVIKSLEQITFDKLMKLKMDFTLSI
jgi:HAD superfamily hydrolase (TIGR01509 family)